MKCGAEKIDITPEIGVWLAGMPRNKPSDSVFSPLYVRAVYLANKTTEIMVIVCDLIGFAVEDIDLIKKYVNNRTGIDVDNLIIAATHTHSGPATTDGPYFNKEQEYFSSLKYKIVDAVESAKRMAVPCKVKVTYGYEPVISEYRRLKDKNGKIWMNWEEFNPDDIVGPAGACDPEVGVISIVDLEHRVITTMFNHAGHPNSLTGFDYAITSDYPGEACRILDENIGGISLFFNGAQGSSDISGFKDRNKEGIKKRGKLLAEAVMESLKEGEAYSVNEELKIISTSISIAKRKIPEEKIIAARKILSKYDATPKSLRDGLDENIHAEILIKLADDRRTSLLIPFKGIRIGNAYIFVEPFELFTEIGLKIKKFSPFPYTFVMGLADGSITYVPTAKAYKEGGYTTLVGKLDEEADSLILDLALKLANELI